MNRKLSNTRINDLIEAHGFMPDGNLNKMAEIVARVCAGLVNQEALCTDHVSAEMNEYAVQRLKNAFTKIEEHFGA